MPPLLGCVLSYALLLSSGSALDVTPAANICAPGVATCAPLAVNQALGNDGAGYASPAEVDCRTGAVAPADGSSDTRALFGGCEAPALDFRYRVSRWADSERSSGSLGPQRVHRTTPSAGTCTGLPPKNSGGGVQGPSFTPMAIYEPLRLQPPAEGTPLRATTARAATRVIDPLDRPPRA